MSKLHIVVEGSIAAGKTRLLHYLKEKLKDNITVYYEPLDQMTNFCGSNILKKHYDDPLGFQLPFQLLVQLCMLERHALGKKSTTPLIIYERSVFSGQVFATNSLEQNHMALDSYQILQKWYKMSEDGGILSVPIDLIIYLDVDSKICLDRVKKRNREGEQNITEEFLSNLQRLHNEWLINRTFGPTDIPVLVINCNGDFTDLIPTFDRLVERLDNFILFGIGEWTSRYHHVQF